MRLYLGQLAALQAALYPAQCAHVLGCCVEPVMYAEKWLLTMFMYNWPFKVAVRVCRGTLGAQPVSYIQLSIRVLFFRQVWDVLLSEGPPAMFCFMLAVFETAKNQVYSIFPRPPILPHLGTSSRPDTSEGRAAAPRTPPNQLAQMDGEQLLLFLTGSTQGELPIFPPAPILPHPGASSLLDTSEGRAAAPRTPPERARLKPRSAASRRSLRRAASRRSSRWRSALTR